MSSRRHLARSRSARASALVALCALALAVPAGAASGAPDDPDGEAAVTQRLQEVQSLPSQWWWDESGPDTRRARALLRQMTLDEKVDMLHGELNNFYGFYNGPIERLGIPALTMADGPAGVRIANPDVNDQEATQLPAPLALAATWDTALAEQYGQVAGDEAFRTGHNVLLSPAVDIARVAQAGRAFEALGEDPLLSGTIGAAEIRGIQSHPVVADIKHYNVYTQETNRLSGGNAVVDERALQEIYTRPFAIGVEQGRPGSAMCAFNKVNGVYACESDELLNQHPQGAARLRGLGDERLRRHAQHHAGDPRRPGPGDAGQHHPADRPGRLLLLRSAPRRRPRRAGARLPDRRRRPADPAAHVRARALRQPARRVGAARGRARRVRAPGRRAGGGAAQERLGGTPPAGERRLDRRHRRGCRHGRGRRWQLAGQAHLHGQPAGGHPGACGGGGPRPARRRCRPRDVRVADPGSGPDPVGLPDRPARRTACGPSTSPSRTSPGRSRTAPTPTPPSTRASSCSRGSTPSRRTSRCRRGTWRGSIRWTGHAHRSGRRDLRHRRDHDGERDGLPWTVPRCSRRQPSGERHDDDRRRRPRRRRRARAARRVRQRRSGRHRRRCSLPARLDHARRCRPTAGAGRCRPRALVAGRRRRGPRLLQRGRRQAGPRPAQRPGRAHPSGRGGQPAHGRRARPPAVRCRPPTGRRASRRSCTRGSVVRSRATRWPASCSAT